MSWKCEVIADSSGKWTGNSLIFATQNEAKNYGRDLMSRWMAVQQHRETEVPDNPTHRWNPDTYKVESLP